MNATSPPHAGPPTPNTTGRDSNWWRCRRVPRLPLGEMHDFGRCVLCGAHAATVPVHETTFPATYAGALVCDDPIACERRRYWRLAA
jgi:hypothetical protein